MTFLSSFPLLVYLKRSRNARLVGKGRGNATDRDLTAPHKELSVLIHGHRVAGKRNGQRERESAKRIEDKKREERSGETGVLLITSGDLSDVLEAGHLLRRIGLRDI